MARPRWRLLVEGLGKIDRAEVDVHPLMLFVGDNNSGKSYLASLLWGLFAMQGEFRLPEGPALQVCEEWLAARGSESPSVEGHTLADEEREMFTRLFDAALTESKAKLVRRIFNDETIDISRLELHNTAPSPILLDWESNGSSSISHMMVHQEGGSFGLGTSDKSSLLAHTAGKIVLGKFSSWERYFEGRFQRGDPVFLPASRTGFMLLYGATAQRGLQQLVRREGVEERRLESTSPALQFLDLIAFGLKSGQGIFTDDADFLERALGGRVELLSGTRATNEYLYRHSERSGALTMALSSSLVTELAPIILVLRHMSDFPVLILEEPEAHLHPHLQRKLAQVIVRLVRKGLYVWVTTHSENFCQQINNFMKIGASEDREALLAGMQQKLGHTYDPERDYLRVDDVAGYEFVNTDDRSTVRELKKHEDGLVMPTFNKELIALGREFDYLDQSIGEQGR